MGSGFSVPKPVKLGFDGIIEGNSETVVVNFDDYNDNVNWLIKACYALASNKKAKKVVYKLYFNDGLGLKKLTQAIAKSMNSRESVVVYGSSLSFFEDIKWVEIWSSLAIESLSIKDEISLTSFKNLCHGLQKNHSINELTFRLLNFQRFSDLSKALNNNSLVKTLCLQYDTKPDIGNLPDSDQTGEGSFNILGSNVHHLLCNNEYITTYCLFGYLENCVPIIFGLKYNKTVKKLVFDNVEVDRESISAWKEVFYHNSSIELIEIKRGFSSFTSMVFFSSLKKNRSVRSLKIHEAMFSESGFMILRDFLAVNRSLKEIEVKCMNSMRLTIQNTQSSVINFMHLINGLTENTSVETLNLSITYNPSRHSIYRGEKICDCLSNLISINTFLVTLKIEGFGLGGTEICSIFSSLRSNSSLKAISLPGNSIEWKDLNLISKHLSNSRYFELIDLSSNNIMKYEDIKATMGNHIAYENLMDIIEVFTHIGSAKVKTLSIVPWFWDTISYPQDIHDTISSAKILKNIMLY